MRPPIFKLLTIFLLVIFSNLSEIKVFLVYEILISLSFSLNYDGESEIPERTFHRHRQAIADIFGVDIVCDRRSGNEYYIENPEVLEENSFTANLFSRLAVDNRLLDRTGGASG